MPISSRPERTPSQTANLFTLGNARLQDLLLARQVLFAGCKE